MPNHTDTLEFRVIRGLPIIKHIVDHAVKSFFRRIPRLHEIMIDVSVVDGPNRSINIRIGSEQCALCVWIKPD